MRSVRCRSIVFELGDDAEHVHERFTCHDRYDERYGLAVEQPQDQLTRMVVDLDLFPHERVHAAAVRLCLARRVDVHGQTPNVST
jgi:hypothetical protein